MIKKLQCTYFFPSIYDIPMTFFIEHKFRIIFADLDNTLVDDEEKMRPPFFDKWYAELSNNNIELYVVTNNTKKARVEAFVDKLPITWYYKAGKQSGAIFTKIIKQQQLDQTEIIVIGDRVTTDILGGNIAGLATVLTTPLVPDRNVFIRYLVRPFEKLFTPKGMISNE